MKRIAAKTIIAAMISGGSVSAFAASPITANGGTDSKDDNATFEAASDPDIVYSVAISWGSMEFTYTAASEGTWDPATHQNNNAQAAAWSWENEANLIQVDNHSNAPIKATLSFAPTAAGVTGGFFTETKGTTALAGNTLSLATAVGFSVINVPSAKAYLQITGGAVTATGKVGAITVTLADA